MNILRKSSLILAGAAAAGLLAFACADNTDGGTSGLTSDISGSKPSDLVIAKVYAGGEGRAAKALDGDYVELYNPTAKTIKLANLALQFADAENKFVKGYIVDLADADHRDAQVESGHYFLVSLKPGAKLGGVQANLEAKPVQVEGETMTPALELSGGSVALIGIEDQFSCNRAEDCNTGSKTLSVFGYGKIGEATPLAEGTAFSKAITSGQAAARKRSGCEIKSADSNNAVDFEIADPLPYDPAVGHDCTANNGDGGAGDGGTPPPNDDAGAPNDGGTSEDGGGIPAETDAGPKPPTGKPDASTTGGEDEEPEDEDGTPAPVAGKKKTNFNPDTQPIAQSKSSGCSSAPGAGSNGLASALGLGLAVAALGRRRRK